MTNKQLNARINTELHNRIKQIQTERKLTVNTFVEELLERGLQAYLAGDVAGDSDRFATRDELEALRQEVNLLKKPSAIGA